MSILQSREWFLTSYTHGRSRNFASIGSDPSWYGKGQELMRGRWKTKMEQRNNPVFTTCLRTTVTRVAQGGRSEATLEGEGSRTRGTQNLGYACDLILNSSSQQTLKSTAEIGPRPPLT
jgi:hypothetical protein